MIQRSSGNRWAIVLAAGAGSRLRDLTTDASRVTTPKQYCSLLGGPTLLEDTLARAARIAAPERTIVVVAAEHERWWREQLAHVPAQNIVIQPRNRGTAAGVYLPLATILARDPQATVALLPSDHHVADENVLNRSLRRAIAAVEQSSEEMILLGVTPDAPESEYGWIVPDDASAAARRASSDAFGVSAPIGVRAFVEKPRASVARELYESGALWSSFLIVAHGATLRSRIARRVSGLARSMHRCVEMSTDELARAYEDVPVADLSRDVLEGDARLLRVLRVPPCGWTDLGTPRRVAERIAAIERNAKPRQERVQRRASVLDLSLALSACALAVV